MAIHVLITGVVHHVGFRKFVRHHARKKGIYGWVRNLPDGSVEAYLCGEHASLSEMVKLMHIGPPTAQVDNVHVEWENDVTYTSSDFEIRR